MAEAQEQISLNEELALLAIDCDKDPLLFVETAFPWGTKGTELEHKHIRQWQRDFLANLSERLQAGEINAYEAIQEARSSGHGIGKSAMVAWIIIWAMATKEQTRGVVTANTEKQLTTKTWAEMAKWHNLSYYRPWFKMTATAYYSRNPKYERTWRIDAVAWSERNTEAFAGLHNEGKRVILIMDEASAIPDVIWEVAEGALTDEKTEIIWLVFGNGTRNVGRFRECFRRYRHRWGRGQIDSRDVEGTNKEQMAKWVADYGEDSDFVKVRVRGLFPSASSSQFVPGELVDQAMRREATSMIGDPLIMTLDVARGGDDNCVFRFRRGLDARVIRPIKFLGSDMRDSMKLATHAAMLFEQYKPDAFFIDSTGVGGPVADRMRQLGYPAIDVNFAAAAPDPKYGNLRAYMYFQLIEWMRAGGAIDDSDELRTELASCEYTHDRLNRLILIPKDTIKEAIGISPDDADALALSFAFPVSVRIPGSHGRSNHKSDAENLE